MGSYCGAGVFQPCITNFLNSNNNRPSGLNFFIPTSLLSILTPLFLPSLSVSLFYLILAVHMRELPISYSRAEWYLFFRRMTLKWLKYNINHIIIVNN